jgi:hypothetical protein
MKRVQLGITALALLMAGVLDAAPAPSAKGVPGAIFTTNFSGTVVNGNQYSSKCDVYLDGGPGPNAPASAAGLPDGEYYFQVTDPSGEHLLSTDPVSNRQFTVAGGVIVSHSGTHPTGIDQDHSAVTVALADVNCPADFLDTPNHGGVYKVWATPVADYVGPATCGNGCFHGFLPANSKTDNFKVQQSNPTFCLSVFKRVPDESGVFQPFEGWLMSVTDTVGTTNSLPTDVDNGEARFCGLSPGMYTVMEETRPDYQVEGLEVNGMDVIADTVYSFTWQAGDPEPVIVFRNVPGEIGPPPM